MAEIKIRTERRAGELLKETERHKGAATPLDDQRALLIPKLKYVEISHFQSHQFQKIAFYWKIKLGKNIVNNFSKKDKSGEITKDFKPFLYNIWNLSNFGWDHPIKSIFPPKLLYHYTILNITC